MGDPHNPARMGELWDPHRWAVLAAEIDAVKEYGAISGGWAWHFMSSPHTEEKHLHDHRDIDFHVFPARFAELTVLLKDRGYHKQATRFDDPSGEFIRFEKYVENACPECHQQGTLTQDSDVERGFFTYCEACQHDWPWGEDETEPSFPVVKVIFDLFVQEVDTIEVNGYTVVEPKLMLTFYGVKHSSEQCVAVQAARKLQERGEEIVGNPLLVGDYGI